MMRSEGRALRLLVLAAAAVGLVLPIAAGLWQTAQAAFGILPGIGAAQVALDPWVQLAGLPGVATSLALTLWTGVASTVLSLALALGIAGAIHGRFGAAWATQVLTPFLALPHAAMAIGLAFLIAPSGWIARLLTPWATGWTVPPDLATVHDPYGIALVLGLVVKEVPFLLLVTLSALGQLPVDGQIASARALGYSPGAAWVRVVAPQVYRLVRLPVFVTLSFALSVVDMALILGPSHPPTLAVAMTRWFFAADTRLILPAAAAALALSALVAGAILIWMLGERALALAVRGLLRRGRRGRGADAAIRLAGGTGLVLLVLSAGALLSLLVWSLTWRWSFPRALPENWSPSAWMSQGSGWRNALEESLFLGLASTIVSLILAVAWLEGEDRGGMRRARWAEALVYLPLIVPQVGFLYGLSVAFLQGGIVGGTAAVVWGHVIFVFPYVLLALSGPWRALDRRMDRAAAALGAGPWRRLFAVKLPILLRPVLVAAAIGFAVSVALYLPTLFLGAGRLTTLTTEAVALSSGSDRRVTGVYATLQAMLPLVAYGAAVLIPALRTRAGRGV